MCDQAQLPSSPAHWKTIVPVCNVFVSGYSAADSQDSRTHQEIKAQQERFRAQNVPCDMESVSSGCLLAFCCFLFLPHSLHSPVKPPSPSSPDFPVFSSVSNFSRYPRWDLGTGSTSLFLSLSMLSLQSSPFILQRGFCSRAFCMCGAAHLEAEWMS